MKIDATVIMMEVVMCGKDTYEPREKLFYAKTNAKEKFAKARDSVKKIGRGIHKGHKLYNLHDSLILFVVALWFLGCICG